MKMRDGSEALDPRLGRIPEFDVRSRMYRAVYDLDDQPPISKMWEVGEVLDQKNTPQCVGYSSAHELLATPTVVHANETTAADIYKLAQHLDQYEGEDYAGTTLLGAGKAMTNMGLISEYRWCFGLRDVIMTVGYKGPVLIGISWTEGMRNPSADGLIRPTGKVLGGHAILILGVDVDLKFALLVNSWGTEWGKGGYCFLTFQDLEYLLLQGGEAMLVKDIPLGGLE